MLCLLCCAAVPAVASRIFLANRGRELIRKINLKGLAIGNGLTVPRVQVSSGAVWWVWLCEGMWVGILH